MSKHQISHDLRGDFVVRNTKGESVGSFATQDAAEQHVVELDRASLVRLNAEVSAAWQAYTDTMHREDNVPERNVAAERYCMLADSRDALRNRLLRAGIFA